MTKILGSLRTAEGAGVVHIEERYDTTIDDLWSSITEPARLARWYGKVAGDLYQGGTFTLFVEGSEWDGTGQIEVCQPPHRLTVTMKQSDESWAAGETPYNEVVDATLTAHGKQTLLTVEVSGLPLAKVGYYGAGWQEDVENLGAYLTGAPPVGPERFDELVPAYLEMATKL